MTTGSRSIRAKWESRRFARVRTPTSSSWVVGIHAASSHATGPSTVARSSDAWACGVRRHRTRRSPTRRDKGVAARIVCARRSVRSEDRVGLTYHCVFLLLARNFKGTQSLSHSASLLYSGRSMRRTCSGILSIWRILTLSMWPPRASYSALTRLRTALSARASS